MNKTSDTFGFKQPIQERNFQFLQSSQGSKGTQYITQQVREQPQTQTQSSLRHSDMNYSINETGQVTHVIPVATPVAKDVTPELDERLENVRFEKLVNQLSKPQEHVHLTTSGSGVPDNQFANYTIVSVPTFHGNEDKYSVDDYEQTDRQIKDLKFQTQTQYQKVHKLPNVGRNSSRNNDMMNVLDAGFSTYANQDIKFEKTKESTVSIPKYADRSRKSSKSQINHTTQVRRSHAFPTKKISVLPTNHSQNLVLSSIDQKNFRHLHSQTQMVAPQTKDITIVQKQQILNKPVSSFVRKQAYHLLAQCNHDPGLQAMISKRAVSVQTDTDTNQKVQVNTHKKDTDGQMNSEVRTKSQMISQTDIDLAQKSRQTGGSTPNVKLEFESRSEEHVSALEQELNKQKHDEKIVTQTKGKSNTRNARTKMGKRENSKKMDQMSQYQHLKVFNYNMDSKNAGFAKKGSYNESQANKVAQIQRFKQNKLQAMAFMHGLNNVNKNFTAQQLMRRTADYPNEGSSGLRKSDMEPTAEQTSGRSSYHRRNHTGFSQNQTKRGPNDTALRVMRLSKGNGMKNNSPMNRTGHRFRDNEKIDTMDKYQNKLKMGAAKFSLPSVLKNDNQDTTTTYGSIFMNTFAKDPRRSTTTHFGIDSQGYDLDQLKSAIHTNKTESIGDELQSQIQDLKAVKKGQTKNKKVVVPPLSLHEKLKKLDNIEVAVQGNEEEFPNNFVAQSSDRRSSGIFGGTYDTANNFNSSDRLSPHSRNKKSVHNKLRAILSSYGTQKKQYENRSTDKISRGNDLISRRLRTHLEEQEALLESEREKQNTIPLATGRSTTDSKYSPLLFVEMSTQKTPRSSAVTYEDDKIDEGLKLKENTNLPEQHEFSYLINKQSLFNKGVHLLNNSLIKQFDDSVYKCLGSFVKKMVQNTKEIDEKMLSVIRQKELLQQGLDNLTSEHSQLNYKHNKLLEQQGAFTKIIEDSKRNEQNFERMFEAAHEYLKSQSLTKFSEKIEEMEIETMTPEQIHISNQIKKLLRTQSYGQDHNIVRLDEDFLAFSGVTDKLDEVVSLQARINPANPNSSQQIDLEDESFAKFMKSLESNMSAAQMQTAYKLWNRTKNAKTFAEVEVQVGAGDLDRKVKEDLKAYEEETDAQRKQIKRQKDQMAKKQTELEQEAKKVIQEQTIQRELKREIDRLEDQFSNTRKEMQKYDNEKQQYERKIFMLFEEIKFNKLKTEQQLSNLTTQNSQLRNPDAPTTQNQSPNGENENQNDQILSDSRRQSVSQRPSANGRRGLNPDDDPYSHSPSDGDENYDYSNRNRYSRKQSNDQYDDPNYDSKNSKSRFKSPSILVQNSSKASSPSKTKSPTKSPGKKIKQSPDFSTKKISPQSRASGENLKNDVKLQSKFPSMHSFYDDQIQGPKLNQKDHQGQFDQIKEIMISSVESNEHGSYEKKRYEKGMPPNVDINVRQQQSPKLLELKTNSNELYPSHMHPKFDFQRHSNLGNSMCISIGTQTDQQIFFEYILEFLRIIEERIKSGQIVIPDMPLDPEEQYLKNMQEQQIEMERSRQKLKELEQILGRIGSLRLGRGGDVFFKSLAKAFQANPIIPAAQKWSQYEIADNYQEETIQNIGSPDSNKTFSLHDIVTESRTPMRYIVKTKLAGSAGGGYQSTSKSKNRDVNNSQSPRQKNHAFNIKLSSWQKH